VGCGVVAADELEAELFGPEPGSDDGLEPGGKVAAARGGSLFLDELEAMPPEVQARLGRFLAREELGKRGGPAHGEGDIRWIAACSGNLRDRVTEGTFREDLYFRFSVVVLDLPPLRDRRDDVVYLAQRFLERYAPEFGRGKLTFSRDALRSLQKHSWPGNVRELEHRVQRGIVMSRGRVIRSEDLDLTRSEPLEVLTLRAGREQGEREAVVDALRRNCGNIARAARELEVSRPTLHDLLRKLEIRAGDYKKGLGPREDGTLPYTGS
jgi:two-component system, NtrC family, response regulator